MPVQRAQAAAASTFSTLCWPRSGMSAVGQRGSVWPLSFATIQPSRTNTPWSNARRRLNHTTRARVRPASAAVGASSALSTTQSAVVWLARIRALASTYRSKVP